MCALRVVIIGAGGHGQTIAEALFAATRAGHPVRAAGFLDDTPELRGTTVAGLPVLGPLSNAQDIECDAFIVGIGDNRARKRIFDELRAAARPLHTVIHPTAVIATTARIGEGTYIGAASVIGDNTIINGAGCVGHHNRIGAHVHLGPGVNAAGHVEIGEGCEIGTGANFLPEAAVGAWSSVVGGALVTGAFEAEVLIGGAPARVLRRLAESAHK